MDLLIICSLLLFQEEVRTQGRYIGYRMMTQRLKVKYNMKISRFVTPNNFTLNHSCYDMFPCTVYIFVNVCVVLLYLRTNVHVGYYGLVVVKPRIPRPHTLHCSHNNLQKSLWDCFHILYMCILIIGERIFGEQDRPSLIIACSILATTSSSASSTTSPDIFLFSPDMV